MLMILFWSALAAIVYTYLLFPLWIFLRGKFFEKPYLKDSITPKVSIIIAAYNEERDIRQKIENLLQLDYPRDKLEVIISSDGSTDGTNEIVSQFADRGIRLMALPRLGKAGALNQAVAAATGELLIFSDANSLYATDAIRHLVQPFADPQIGGVAGNQCYLKKGQNLTGVGEQGYWSYDRFLKVYESRGGNTISATGAIYAIRRELFQTVPEGVTDDFVTSTRVIAQGKRLVFTPDAIAYEPVAASTGIEYGRKVRVMTRGLNSVLVMRELLNPFRYGFYAVQLFSHKILRRLLFVPMLMLVIVCPFLWSEGLFYQLVSLGQLIFCGLAAWGFFMERMGKKPPKFLALPFFVVVVYVAAANATWNIVMGRQIKRWEPQRQS